MPLLIVGNTLDRLSIEHTISYFSQVATNGVSIGELSLYPRNLCQDATKCRCSGSVGKQVVCLLGGHPTLDPTGLLQLQPSLNQRTCIMSPYISVHFKLGSGDGRIGLPSPHQRIPYEV